MYYATVREKQVALFLEQFPNATEVTRLPSVPVVYTYCCQPPRVAGHTETFVVFKVEGSRNHIKKYAHRVRIEQPIEATEIIVPMC